LAAGATVKVGTDLTGTLATGGLGEHHDDDHDVDETKTSLTANLTGSGTSTGTVSFKSETEDGVAKSLFTASVQGATANSLVPVSINGTGVGQIQPNASANGSLGFSTTPTGTQLAFPANFPTSLTAGAAVSIGSLTGTLGTTSAEVKHNAVVSANLTGTTAATGSALFVNENLHGLALMFFTVNIKGATPGAALDVTVAGTKVGTITADASGNGTLVFSSVPAGSALAFPANFPTNVGAGASISVGTILNGTLATSASH